MFLKRIFTRKKNAFFDYEIRRMLFSDSPSYYGEEAVRLVKNLNDIEKRKIEKTIDAFHDGLYPLYRFWITNVYSHRIVKQNSDEIFKSYAELNTIEWIFLINYLRKQKVKENVIETIFFIIKYSFDAMGNHIFSTDNFKNFETAVKERGNIYMNIIEKLYNPRKNEIEVYNNLFILFIEKPMIKDVSLRIDFLNFGDVERMKSSLKFNKRMGNILAKFNKKIENIW